MKEKSDDDTQDWGEEWLASRRELFRPCAFAYRVEESSGPETYQNSPEEFPNGGVTELTKARD
jgi:hypothetical protein